MSETLATFVVMSSGRVGDEVAQRAAEHASFDPRGRRVVRRRDLAPEVEQSLHSATAAAVVLNTRNEPAAFLDERQASIEAWIEDAFVRASRAN